MNPLQYTSNEMVSSTELIRKSKKVFDSLQKGEIEKAIILRDGKPSFMLMDFSAYEEIMSEYLSLKEMLHSNDKKKKQNNDIEIKEEKIKEAKKSTETKELDDEDLENALAEIESLDLDTIDEEDNLQEPLKEFWE